MLIADIKVGLFGIGADGHTAGILPGSSVLTDSHIVSTYTGPDFQRITITPLVVAKLDVAIAFATGSKKASALSDLQKDLSISQQPAQVLKLANSTYIYTNQVEENS